MGVPCSCASHLDVVPAVCSIPRPTAGNKNLAQVFVMKRFRYNTGSLRILGMSWGVKTTCLEAPGVSLGGSGVSIGGVKIVRVG